jgi:hypothetical protein
MAGHTTQTFQAFIATPNTTKLTLPSDKLSLSPTQSTPPNESDTPHKLPPFRLHPAMVWDVLVYALMGASLSGKHTKIGTIGGITGGIGLNYCFDVLESLSQKGQDHLNEQWDTNKQNSITPNLWLPPLLYSTLSVLRGFWFLDQIDRHPTQSFSKMQAMENVLLSKELLAGLKRYLNPLGQNAPLNLRQKWKRLLDYLELDSVQHGTLGLSGAHQTAKHFVAMVYKDGLHADKVTGLLSQPVMKFLTFLMETFRGLPVTYAQAGWLQTPKFKAMPMLNKMAKARWPLAGDIIWLTTVLLSWNVLAKSAYQWVKQKIAPPVLTPQEYVVRT